MTTTLGTMTVPALNFAAGLPGFPGRHHFALVRLHGDEDVGLYWMRSLDEDGLQFVVAAPVVFFPGYAPEIDDETVERLGLSGADDALLLVIVTVAGDPHAATANLMAPIVINRNTLAAAQVVLPREAHSLREPLYGQFATP